MFSLLNYIITVDESIGDWILSWRNANWDSFFFLITYLGHWLVIGVISIVVIYFFRKSERSFFIIPFLVSILGSGISTLIIKLIVDRDRPIGDIVLYIEKLPSFPSAHAALAFALFGFIVYCVYHKKLSKLLKILVIPIFILIIIFVGLSRLYLGVHFFSDVLGGYLVGLLWLLIAMYLSHKFFHNTQT